jgi:hypothetical protein
MIIAARRSCNSSCWTGKSILKYVRQK